MAAATQNPASSVLPEPGVARAVLQWVCNILQKSNCVFFLHENTSHPLQTTHLNMGISERARTSLHPASLVALSDAN